MSSNPNGRGQARSRRQMWSADDDALLRERFPLADSALLAAEMGRSLASLRMRAVKLKLRKAPEYEPKGRLQPGNKPWNTGRKGYVTKGSEATQFKKGNMPASALKLAYYDGQVIPKQDNQGTYYQYRRIRCGKWVPNHRYNWIEQHGPIPKNMVLRCRTGDTLNDHPDNWELLTRKEHALRNNVGSDNPASKQLTPAFVAHTLTRSCPELKHQVLANLPLLEAQRLRLTLNRLLDHGTPTQRKH